MLLTSLRHTQDNKINQKGMTKLKNLSDQHRKCDRTHNKNDQLIERMYGRAHDKYEQPIERIHDRAHD